MNQIAKEIASYLGSAELSDDEFIEHYGMPRRSGRYPWGSGEDPYQHGKDFLSRVEELKKQGWTETTENIKKEFGMNSSQYRREKSICKDQRRMYKVDTAKALRKDGLNNSEIARKMGVGESTVRSWFNEESDNKMRKCKETAEFLKKRLDELPEGKKMIDVGVNVERELNISRERLDTALLMLEKEGYHVHGGRVPQVTNKNQTTTVKALCDKDVPHSAIFNYENVQPLTPYISRDGGVTFEKKFTYPSSIDRNRIYIRYPDEGGDLKDGIIELRRNVPDLSLGESRYSQVRILVENKSYLKGMAVYSDDMPDGVDIVFNTSKKRGTDEWDGVMKKIKKDPDNPFGSAIKDADQGGQYWYDSKTGERVSSKHPNAKLGLINKRSDEGDWSEWADALPSQFLAKQSQQMAKKQLDLARADKEAEFDAIMQLNNPTIKKHYLEKFASSCDSAAVSLKAAALPGQKYHVIIPVNTLKDTEVYAPQYKNGTKLALIRYPHGGIFEIPILTVNNKNASAKNIIGPTSTDAVGINKKIADMLSGADFDGDTVMCIPTHGANGKVKIASKPEGLKDLKGFDNKAEYQYTHKEKDADGNDVYYRGTKKFHVMKATDNEMGKISNLITDMTLAGATDDELARAVKHSMVVIDAEKHKLDYQQSYKDNNIAALKLKYQLKTDPVTGEVTGAGGAATIISKAKGVEYVDKRRGEPKKNIKGKSWYDPTRPEGALIYTKAKDEDLYYVNTKYDKKTGVVKVPTADGKTITYNMYNKDEVAKYKPVMKKDNKTGEVYYTSGDGAIRYATKTRTIESTRMAETDDAMTLVSKARHPMELLYADYANAMKAMANRARVEVVNTGNLEYSKTANKIYKNEVASLEVKLNDALKNSPKERYAGRLAASEVKRKTAENPDMKPSEIKKISQRSLSKAREEVGSVSRRERSINITDKEWEAIQAGAISENRLKLILKNSDPDVLRERAMPKDRKTLSTAQINRIKRLSDSDFTLNQIAEKMNIPASTVSKYLKGEK